MTLRLCFFLVFACAIFMPNEKAWAMSIDEAYQSIPHRQTPYNPQQSLAPEVEAQYLHDLFTLTDEAMRIRVMLLGKLYHDHDVDMPHYSVVYTSLLSKVAALQPPEKALPAQSLIVEAIEEQHLFFKKWSNAGQNNAEFKQYHKNELVRSAHKKLLNAYNILMRVYPKETAHNRQAFFDHLCALDFL